MNPVVDFINVNRDRYVEELKQYLAIPSISALPQHAADVRRAAQWTADALSSAGMQNVRLIDTPGNPVVRPLRRATRRSIEFMDDAAVRGERPRRRDLRAWRRGRQGPGVHAHQ